MPLRWGGEQGQTPRSFLLQLKSLGTLQERFRNTGTPAQHIINSAQRSRVPTTYQGNWKLEHGLDGSGGRIQ